MRTDYGTEMSQPMEGADHGLDVLPDGVNVLGVYVEHKNRI